MKRERLGQGPVAARRWLRLGAGMALLAACTLARAALCTVSTTSVSFDAYDTFSNSPGESTGTVTVSCDAIATYSLAINAGGSGSFSRAMSFGADQLAYNLFTDATRAVVWGDGTGATARVNQLGTGATHVVYGRIPARQNVRAGTYLDTLIVTVEF